MKHLILLVFALLSLNFPARADSATLTFVTSIEATPTTVNETWTFSNMPLVIDYSYLSAGPPVVADQFGTLSYIYALGAISLPNGAPMLPSGATYDALFAFASPVFGVCCVAAGAPFPSGFSPIVWTLTLDNGTITGAFGNEVPTPEPETLVLAGTGLLLFMVKGLAWRIRTHFTSSGG